MQALSVCGLTKAHGAVTVADGIAFEVAGGEALGVIGPNGAGKTTLFNLITGTARADAGTIRLFGRDVSGVPAAMRCRMGLARSFQVPQPFGHMTVFENALVGATRGAGERGRAAEALALDALERTGLLAKANIRAGRLTLLERKRLELTRALAARPKLLMLDEIAGGLTDAECHDLIGTIRRIHASGVTIIWSGHIVHALLAVVNRLIVIDFGEKIAEGGPRAIMASPKLREICMGIEGDG